MHTKYETYASLPDRSHYFLRPRRVALPLARVFAFPYAGASAVAYHEWGAALGSDIELVSLQYPGRGLLTTLTLCRRIDEIVDVCREVILALGEVPFYFFGHSMGATVAFELTNRLRAEGDPMPQALIVSSRAAPGAHSSLPFNVVGISDEELLARVTRYGGMRQEILRSPEMLEIVLPILRADLEALNVWRYEPRAPLDLPILALGGDRDGAVPPEHLDGWRALTRGTFHRCIIPGGHFYISEQRAEVIAELERLIRRTLPAA